MSKELEYTEDDKGVRTFDLTGRCGIFYKTKNGRPGDIVIFDKKHKYEIRKDGSFKRIKK